PPRARPVVAQRQKTPPAGGEGGGPGGRAGAGVCPRAGCGGGGGGVAGGGAGGGGGGGAGGGGGRGGAGGVFVLCAVEGGAGRWASCRERRAGRASRTSRRPQTWPRCAESCRCRRTADSFRKTRTNFYIRRRWRRCGTWRATAGRTGRTSATRPDKRRRSRC